MWLRYAYKAYHWTLKFEIKVVSQPTVSSSGHRVICLITCTTITSFYWLTCYIVQTAGKKNMKPFPVPWSPLFERALLTWKVPRIRCDFLIWAVQGIYFSIAPNPAALSYRDIMPASIYPARAAMLIFRAKETYYITVKMSIEHWWHGTDREYPK
jgi:hypothetical protein